jgi:fused signal recognition particle receptor
VIEVVVLIAVLFAAIAVGLVISRGRRAAPPPAPADLSAAAKAPPKPAAPPKAAEKPAVPAARPPAPAPKPSGGLADRIRSLFPGGGATADTWKGLEEALIRADVGPAAAADVVARVKEGYTPSMDPAELVVDEVARTFARDEPWRAPSGPDGKPGIVMVVGVNGTGKTTTIGKIAARLQAEGRSVGMAASDTFRAAAGEQLGVWAERTGASLVSQERGADPGAVAFDAVKAAEARGVDVLIVDTAGRLHTRTPLMEELKKVRRVIEKAAGRPPDEVLLVVDATTGQNGVQQAESFTEAVDVSGVVLTKLDGTARGGIVLAVRTQLGIPVVLVGTGEGADDLAPFDAESFARGLVS